MRRPLRLAGPLSLALLLASVAVPDARAQVAGRVVEAGSGEPVGGATVRAAGLSTTTDAAGAFALPGARGIVVLRVSRIGYAAAERTVEAGPEVRVEVILRAAVQELATYLAEADRPRSAASSQTVRAFDLLTRPTRSTQDLLRLVPGLVVAQHAGGGKAEQIFLRGFDVDHGTDISLSVDGLPVNMVSHGHGQGYADLHFVMPDVIEAIDVNKGPYRAEDGNLATAGAVAFRTKDRLDESLVRVGVGAYGTRDALALVGLNAGERTSAYAAGQFYRFDGPFASPQTLRRVNLFGKVTTELPSGGTIRASASGFTSAWDASGQVPQRAVERGLIGRFGALNDLEGGATSREDLSVQYEGQAGGADLSAQAFLTRYRFKLFSDFTFFLVDPVNGDMIEQSDRRAISGFNARYRRPHRVGGGLGTASFGGSTRADRTTVALYQSPDRVRGATLVNADVDERNIGLWAEEDLVLSPGLRVIAGLRADYFTFDVDDALDGVANGLTHASGADQSFIVSPKASVIVSPTKTVDVFANVGSGFHSNDARAVVTGRRVRDLTRAYRRDGLSDAASDEAIRAQGFDPDQRRVGTLPRAIGGEVGVRARLFDRLNVAAAFWRLDLEEEFVYVGDAGVTEPSGRSRRYGADLEARASLTSWLVADADLNLSRGTLVDEPAGADEIPLAPRLTTTGGLTARHPRGVSGSLRFVHIGDRPANEDNSVVARGYTLVNAGASYRLRAYELSATLENALNVEWNEAQFDTESRLKDEAAPVSELHFTPGNPRNVRVALSYRF